MQAYTNKLGLKTVDVAASMLLWGRGKHKQNVLLIQPDPRKVLAAACNDASLQLGDFTELVNLARFTWLVEAASWLSVHDQNNCLYCDKYAEVREVPCAMNALRSSLVGKKFRFEEDMIAQRVLTMAKVVLKQDEFTNIDVIVPNKLLPGVLQGLQKYWKYYDSEGKNMSTEQYLNNYRTYTSIEANLSAEKSGLFAGLLLGSRQSPGIQRMKEALTPEERRIADKVAEVLSLEQTIRAQGTKPRLKGVSCLAVQGICPPSTA
jgi:hypothetical protein